MWLSTHALQTCWNHGWPFRTIDLWNTANLIKLVINNMTYSRNSSGASFLKPIFSHSTYLVYYSNPLKSSEILHFFHWIRPKFWVFSGICVVAVNISIFIRHNDHWHSVLLMWGDTYEFWAVTWVIVQYWRYSTASGHYLRLKIKRSQSLRFILSLKLTLVL